MGLDDVKTLVEWKLYVVMPHPMHTHCVSTRKSWRADRRRTAEDSASIAALRQALSDCLLF
jgi:hypothetical protein